MVSVAAVVIYELWKRGTFDQHIQDIYCSSNFKKPVDQTAATNKHSDQTNPVSCEVGVKKSSEEEEEKNSKSSVIINSNNDNRTTIDMISRRKILSRSRDELNSADFMEEEEDIWYDKDKLHKDHIREVLNKWHQIDDEIWAKIICMERNRRVAKAYARAPVLTISGSDHGFDGFRIGLCGFDNPLRDAKTEEVRKHIGNGVKIKMDDTGNIMIKKVSRSNVYVKGTSSKGENSIANDICKQKGQLEMDKPVKLFDFKKFENNINRELTQSYPDRRKLEAQCICTVCFVRNEQEVLDCPCWIMIINVVALDMLKSKLPPMSKKQSVPNIKLLNNVGGLNGGRSASSMMHNRLNSLLGPEAQQEYEDDPYGSSTGSASSSSQENNYKSNGREPKPPKLPPRDAPTGREAINSKNNKNSSSKQEKPSSKNTFTMRDSENDHHNHRHLSSRKKMPHIHDDPYYCGMRARIPNFAKKVVESGNPQEHKKQQPMKKSHSTNFLPRNNNTYADRKLSFTDSGLDSDLTGSSDDAYNSALILGKMKTGKNVNMFNGYQLDRQLRGSTRPFVGEWE